MMQGQSDLLVTPDGALAQPFQKGYLDLRWSIYKRLLDNVPVRLGKKGQRLSSGILMLPGHDCGGLYLRGSSVAVDRVANVIISQLGRRPGGRGRLIQSVHAESRARAVEPETWLETRELQC